MANTFLIADTHFGHKAAPSWRDFNSVEEMDEHMVINWNNTVTSKDTVYVLGDFVINRSALQIARRLNGKKILIKGNHDTFRASEYLEYFEDLMGSHSLDNNILTHIPIHPHQLTWFGGRWKKNIHGHLHDKRVMMFGDYEDYFDVDYICVSVEQINYTPIAYEELKKGWQ